MKRILVLVICVLGFLACYLLAGNSGVQPEKTETEVDNFVEKSDPGTIGEVILRDKPLLYENMDPLSVKTYYLTVRRGSDNTDHSWDEINTYSSYDYESWGVPRYQVEAILQEGNENGPQPGMFGYVLTTPNSTVQVRGQTSTTRAQKIIKLRSSRMPVC